MFDFPGVHTLGLDHFDAECDWHYGYDVTSLIVFDPHRAFDNLALPARLYVS